MRLTLRRWHDERGAWLPLSAITEAERGLWAVYRLDTDANPATADRALVEVLAVEDERVFVRTALPDGAVIVADGVHRLAPGLPVRSENQP